MKGIKWKKYILSFGIPVLTLLISIPSFVSSASMLQQTKEEARNVYYMKNIYGKNVREKAFIIDGSVDERGKVKIQIDNWTDKAITKSDKELPVYDKANSNRIIGKIYEDTIASVLSIKDGWVWIHSGYLQGYVKSEDVLVGEKAKEKVDEVCPVMILSDYPDTEIMSAADDSGVAMAYMIQRKPYELLEMQDGWGKIKFSEKDCGFVKLEAVTEIREIYLGRTLMDIECPQKVFIKENLTKEERRLLAAMIYCEARGEGIEGQTAVGAVIMNRVHSDKFPNSVLGVIYQSGQFEPVGTGAYTSVLADDSVIPDSCYEAADIIIQGGSNVDALYFKRGIYGYQIGMHGFY